MNKTLRAEKRFEERIANIEELFLQFRPQLLETKKKNTVDSVAEPSYSGATLI